MPFPQPKGAHPSVLSSKVFLFFRYALSAQRLADFLFPEQVVVAQGETVGFIPDPLQEMKHRGIGPQLYRVFASGQIDPVFPPRSQKGFFGDRRQVRPLFIRQGIENFLYYI